MAKSDEGIPSIPGVPRIPRSADNKVSTARQGTEQYPMDATYVSSPQGETTSLLFYKKVLYNFSTVSQYENLTNFNFGEKLLYGRVNRNYVPIEGNFGSRGLKYFNRNQTVSTPQQAANYVVDAFNAMAQQFDKCALLGKIDASDPYLSNLVVHRSYENPRLMYERYYDSYIEAMADTLTAAGVQVKDFGHFMDEMYSVVANSARTMPFTYPAFVKSRRCPVSISGLSIDIAPLDPNNDVDKINHFYNSKNWDFYVNTCRSYGFMVDENIPWRMVADIGSSEMIQRARKYNMNSTGRILNTHYVPAYRSFYHRFKERLLVLYNRIKPAVIIEIEECDGRVRNKLTYPQVYANINEIKARYTEEVFLRLYCNLRFLEEESTFTENEKEIMIDDVIEIAYGRDANTALAKFEIIINKTFDYNGSLSYIIRGQKN